MYLNTLKTVFFLPFASFKFNVFSYFKFLLGVNKWSGLMICQIQKLHIMRLFCNIVAYEDIKRQRQQKVVP